MNTAKVRKIASNINQTLKQFRKKQELNNRAKDALKTALDSYNDKEEMKPEFHKNMKTAKKLMAKLNESTELSNGYHEGTLVKIKEGENEGKTGVVVYSAGKGTHHSVESLSGKHLGFHPTSNLLNIEKPIQEQEEPHIGSKVRAIRGREDGRVERIARDKNGVEKIYFKTDDGRIVDTPISNVKLESNMNFERLKKVKAILAEATLLLEYNEGKTWDNYGSKISARMSEEGHPVEQHREIFNHAVQEGDPTKNKEYGKWIAEKYANGGISRLEDVGARIRPALERFHEHKKRGTLANFGVHPDILKYKTTNDIVSAARQLPEKVETETGMEKEAKATAANSALRHKQGENEHWEHFVLNNGDATHDESKYLAQKHGGGTNDCEWCTAANSERSKNLMNHYTEDGPLHILIPKNPKHPGERYQSHLESNQFMDEKDEDTDPMTLFKDRPMPKSYDDHLETALQKVLADI